MESSGLAEAVEAALDEGPHPIGRTRQSSREDPDPCRRGLEGARHVAEALAHPAEAVGNLGACSLEAGELGFEIGEGRAEGFADTDVSEGGLEFLGRCLAFLAHLPEHGDDLVAPFERDRLVDDIASAGHAFTSSLGGPAFLNGAANRLSGVSEEYQG